MEINSNGYGDPTINVHDDTKKEECYEKNLQVLQRVLQAVKVCAT